ncbi:MAG TPA: DUF4390 domain-containing protein [Thermoanaerobaculia bacterium]|nr:DUF4390 domain-containing protein [Thermoanaerobaculia bacterium]
MRATVALLCLFLLFVLATDVWAAVEISDFKVAVDGDRALVSLKLERAFTSRMWERVDSGLPTGILYHFFLEKDRKRWYDRQLQESTFEIVTTFDAVEHQYTISYKLNGKLVESRTVHDPKALAGAMTRIEALPVFTLDKLPNSWRLLIKARAELGSKTVLGLIPVLLTTEWVESRKFRVTHPPPSAP